MQYKIEVLYLSGWDDAGWTEETGDLERPMRFGSTDEAQGALEEHFDLVKSAVLAGSMDVEENPNHYRIVAVK